MKKLITIIWARPQFIKHAPVDKIIKKYAKNIVIHTWQHFDKNMSDIFFQQLEIDKPHYNLNIHWWNHWEMTWKMMIEIEKIVLKESPDFILVYGDTNSTLAWALVWAKLHIPIIHVEAWLRSFDKKMPEEINRILTDHSSTYLLSPTQQWIENLKNEWITKWIFRIQDPMYLTANYFLSKTEKLDLLDKFWLKKSWYYFVTIHRPSNTDNKKQLVNIINLLNNLNKPVLFPIHPRTQKRLEEFWIQVWENIKLIQPTWYLETLYFMKNSDTIITDSGWLQKEAYILWKNIFTVRNTTEWIETVEIGKNKLILDKNWELLSDAKELIENYRWWEYKDFYWEGENLEDLFGKIIN